MAEGERSWTIATGVGREGRVVCRPLRNRRGENSKECQVYLPRCIKSIETVAESIHMEGVVKNQRGAIIGGRKVRAGLEADVKPQR